MLFSDQSRTHLTCLLHWSTVSALTSHGPCLTFHTDTRQRFLLKINALQEVVYASYRKIPVSPSIHPSQATQDPEWTMDLLLGEYNFEEGLRLDFHILALGETSGELRSAMWESDLLFSLYPWAFVVLQIFLYMICTIFTLWMWERNTKCLSKISLQSWLLPSCMPTVNDICFPSLSS